jgi:hypothetical protein
MLPQDLLSILAAGDKFALHMAFDSSSHRALITMGILHLVIIVGRILHMKEHVRLSQVPIKNRDFRDVLISQLSFVLREEIANTDAIRRACVS